MATPRTPYELIQFIRDKVSAWDSADITKAKYLLAWAQAACVAQNKTSGKNTSQLGLHLNELDSKTENFEEREMVRLKVTICDPNAAPGGGSTSLATFNPTINVLPERGRLYMRGADAHKRAIESLTPASAKFTDDQMNQLMAFCGLGPLNRHNVPSIWKSWMERRIGTQR